MATLCALVSSGLIEDETGVLLLPALTALIEQLLRTMVGRTNANREWREWSLSVKRSLIDEAMSPDNFKEHFRFFPWHLDAIQEALGMPDQLLQRNGSSIPSWLALRIGLRRLAFPTRYCDMELLFGMPGSSICHGFYAWLDWLAENWLARLDEFDFEYIEQRAPFFAAAVAEKTGGMSGGSVIGFIDGTKRFIARPTRGQQSAYSGHKRRHCLKYEGICLANGLLGRLSGPVDGRRHDSFMMAEGGLPDSLKAAAFYSAESPTGRWNLYGDSAYPAIEGLLTAYSEAQTEEEQEYNHVMNAARTEVEHSFAGVTNEFESLDLVRQQRSLLSPVALFYKAAVFFYNIKSCIYGNQTASYFGCYDGLDLQEYLG